jgi:hypothetical protein
MAFAGPGRFVNVPTIAETTAAYEGNHMTARPGQAVDLAAVRGNIAADNGTAARLLDVNSTLNPKFDPRIYAQSTAAVRHGTGPLVRGRLSHWDQEKTAIAGAAGTYTRALNFLYNPNAIQHQYAFNEDFPNAGSIKPEDQSRALMTGQTVMWTLLFNRTYEMHKDIEHPGVLGDITALEYLLGGLDTGTGITSVQSLVVFGATPKLKAFAFSGWITGVTIRYGMFTHRMMPSVAEVDLSMTRRHMTTDTGTTPPGTTSTTEIGTADGGAAAGGATARTAAPVTRPPTSVTDNPATPGGT